MLWQSAEIVQQFSGSIAYTSWNPSIWKKVFHFRMKLLVGCKMNLFYRKMKMRLSIYQMYRRFHEKIYKWDKFISSQDKNSKTQLILSDKDELPSVHVIASPRMATSLTIPFPRPYRRIQENVLPKRPFPTPHLTTLTRTSNTCMWQLLLYRSTTYRNRDWQTHRSPLEFLRKPPSPREPSTRNDMR